LTPLLSKTFLGNLEKKQAVTNTKLFSFRMDIKSKVTTMHQPTTFSLIKKQLDQSSLRSLIKKHEADKHSKGFDTSRHLLVMIMAQLLGCKSLREVELTLNSHYRRHYHLGLSTVKRSSLSYANKHRPLEVFTELLQGLVHNLGRKQKTEIDDLLLLLDSTSITLKGYQFDEWTKATKTRCTQGLKLHVEYCPYSLLTTFCQITPPNVNDLSVAREMTLQEDATYVFDKGYCDYDWWLKIDENKSHFVTRLKRNAAIRIIETRTIRPEISDLISEDAIICFNNKNPRAGKKLQYTKPLRRIIVKLENKKDLILVTNELNIDAQEVADLYKSRWLIELFFKWIKQNLKIKRFMGRNENAVHIQIITALIAYALVVMIHRQIPTYGSLREILLMIKTRLFEDADFEKPPPMRQRLSTTAQLKLGLVL
jgi:putative transposase